MKKYKCATCHYIYDEYKGEPWMGIRQGTRFADLPKDFICPVCMADKTNFIEYTEEEIIKDFFKKAVKLKSGEAKVL